jgi:phosphoribosylformylglycinamidine (FGAM) synthase-like enzyme
MYKHASKLGLRIATGKGNLSVEQLWDLSQIELSNAIKAVKKVLKKTDDDELSFLEDTKVVDVENQLRFDILKDVYLTKKKEAEDLRTAKEVKARNQKIIEIIAEKEEGALKDKSIDELKTLIQ